VTRRTSDSVAPVTLTRIGYRYPFPSLDGRRNLGGDCPLRGVTYGGEVTRVVPVVSVAILLVFLATGAGPSAAFGDGARTTRNDLGAAPSVVDVSNASTGRGVLRQTGTPAVADTQPVSPRAPDDDGLASIYDVLAGAATAMLAAGSYLGARSTLARATLPVSHRGRLLRSRSRVTR